MDIKIYRPVLITAMIVFLASCMSAPQTGRLNSTLPKESESRVLISDVPFFPQQEYQCGPAALATLLNHSGVDVNALALVDDVYVPGRQGSFQVEMIAAARTHGRLVYQLEPSLADLILEVQADNPVLVLQNLGLSIRPQWHFAVVKGYDLIENKLILNSGEIEDYSLSLKIFERTWARAQHWALVVEVPGQVPATASSQKYFHSIADLQHSYTNSHAITLAYESGLEHWPSSKELLLGLGNHYLAGGHLEEAASTYFIAVRRYPAYSPALNNLAHTLHELGRTEEALAYSEQAIRHAGDYQDTYQQTYEQIVENIQ